MDDDIYNIINNCFSLETMHPGGLRLTDRAFRLAGLAKELRCADIGCGIGATCAYLSKKYDLDMLGLDKSEVLIGKGRLLHPGLKLLCHDCISLPFENGSLDAAFMECSLSVIGHHGDVISECARVLKPGGRLILSDITIKSQAGNMELGYLSEEGLIKFLSAGGFAVRTLENHTPALKTYAAELFSNADAASIEAICQGMGNINLRDLEYALFIAVKNKP